VRFLGDAGAETARLIDRFHRLPRRIARQAPASYGERRKSVPVGRRSAFPTCANAKKSFRRGRLARQQCRSIRGDAQRLRD
jgi:hypothetical protein